MFRRAESSWIVFVALLAATLLAGGPLSAQTRAQAKPSSDLLLPYFEVDLADGGTTTLFAVSNGLDKPVDLLATIHTNWGVEVLSVPVKLKAKELWTGDLRDWLVEGDLPGTKELTAAELAHLQAALSGQASPSDGLYYSAAAGSGYAVGSLTFRTLGSRPDALRGEFFLVDPDQGTSPGQLMADVDRAAHPNAGCFRHNVRHLSGGGFGSSQVTLWMDSGGEALPATAPEDRRRKVTVSALSSAGKLLKRQQLRLLPVDKVAATTLGLTQALGRLVLVTESESFVGVQPAGSAKFETSCAKGTPPTRPAIKVVTLVSSQGVAAQDANAAPGPSIAIGSAITWQYRVSNVGAGALTKIAVTGGDGTVVKCPKTILQPGETMTCKSRDVAEACQQRNTGTVRASGKNASVTAQDPAYYFGDDGSEITVVVSTNGEDANDPTGPSVPAGSVVNWSYLVTNSGTLRLYEVEVADSQGVAVTCPKFTLAPGEVMTCTAKGIAAAGQHANVGTATADTACGTVSDTDSSHYFGEDGSDLELQARVNGFDADSEPGPTVATGAPLTWTYLVTNEGELTLYDLAVSDEHGAAVTCPDTTLAPGDDMTCVARGVAASCQATHNATVTGATVQGAAVSATDSSHYVGQEQAKIGIETSTNGNDADQAPGPTVAVGAPVRWTYVVTNLGKVVLTGVTVSDDKKVAVTCPQDDLRPGQSMTCTASGTAASGDYRNVGTVTADDPCGSAVTASDASNYRGSGSGGIKLTKLVNGTASTTPPGPTLTPGSGVTWSYVVLNTGQAAVTGVSVTDDQGVAVSCPKTGLLAGESMTCTGSGIAQACQYVNVGTATATNATGQTVTATSTSYYTGSSTTGLTLETGVNGQDADTSPGATISVGTTLTWTYTVSNTGSVSLGGLQVSDTLFSAISCPATTLAAGASMICSASGTAQSGTQSNVGRVTGTPPCGSQVSAQDTAYYTGGGNGGVEILKSVNGEDANDPTGPVIAVGDPVTWTYEVTNSGLLALSSVSVTDNKGVVVSCPKNALAVGESMTCTGLGVAAACQYQNFGSVTAQTSEGGTVGALDPAYYFGQVAASATIDSSINGQDAGTSPGVSVTVGETVAWSYVVTNTGSAALSDLVVTSDQGVPVSCPAATLAAGAAMTCTASDTAGSGTVTAVATLSAETPCGDAVTASDTSYYTSSSAVMTLRKLTNGQDITSAPGPTIEVGKTVSWSYVVTNLSGVDIQGLAVGDDQGVVVTCPQTTVAAGSSVTCTGSGVAEACQYQNIGTASGVLPGGSTITATDTSWYYGQSSPSLSVAAQLNGAEYATPSGLDVLMGSTLTWSYTVTNTGDSALSNLQVSDSQGAVATCNATTLAAGASTTCVATGTALRDQRSVITTASAQSACGSAVSGTDTTYYYGNKPEISVTTRINGSSVDSSLAYPTTAGSTATWSYLVTNTGNVELSSIAVSDSVRGPVSCPQTSLAAGASMTCSVSGTVSCGLNSGTATATGANATWGSVTHSDTTYVDGQEFAVGLSSLITIAGKEWNQPPGYVTTVGAPIVVSTFVQNLGSTAVTVGFSLSGPGVFSIACPNDVTLAAGAGYECDALYQPVLSSNAITAFVSGSSYCGVAVSTEDSAYVFGTIP